MAMSDRDLTDRIFETLVDGFANSEVTVSRTSGTIYLSEDGVDWSLHLFSAQPKKSEHN